MSTELKKSLQAIGLRDLEARVYATLVEHSPASAATLAKLNRLSRSTVYTVLQTLLSKGLIGTTHKNNIKQFTVLDPNSLERFLEREKESLRKRIEAHASLQHLLQSYAPSLLRTPAILTVEGQEGLKKIYTAMMREAPPESTLYLLRDEFVWDADWNFIFTPEWHARIKRYKQEKNLRTKLLVNDSSLERSKALFYQSRKGMEYRYLLPQNAVRDMALYILNDTICLLSMERHNLLGVQIINAGLTKNFTSLFEMLWQSSTT